MLGVVLTEARPGLGATALEKGLLINQPAENVLRIVPPLNIPDADIHDAVTIIKELLS